MTRLAILPALLLFAQSSFSTASEPVPTPSYAVVVSRKTQQDPDWKKVVNALVAKHQAKVIAYDKLAEAKASLKESRPKYACFVATPAEAGKEFVAQVHRLTRQLNDDPYTDVIWGILTGYDAANALSIAKLETPLEIRKVAAGTEVALDQCEAGVWFSELVSGKVVRKAEGKTQTEKKAADSTQSIVDTLNTYQPDLFVTSGHATERDWQIGFRYRNGYFKSDQGKLYGQDTKNAKHWVDSKNPKVYLAVGNCLMGHIDSQDAMALAWLKSAGVTQMVGYTVVTWFGYGGWGMLDYFVEQPGRFTLAEAFFANHQALLHKLETEFPQDARKESGDTTNNGLLYDRDVVAFYGDPVWVARMKPAECAWDQKLTVKGNLYTLTITPKRGEKTFEPINTNGSQRGGRPIFEFLPHRVKNVEITGGKELAPVVTEGFILVPLPKAYDANRKYEVTFQAEVVK